MDNRLGEHVFDVRNDTPVCSLAAPSGTSASACSASVGATAASSSDVPNRAALPTSSAGVMRPRAPAASAPSTEPTPMTAVSVA